MAESPEVDFRNDYSPIIPEIANNVQCPLTPGPQLNIKSPDLGTASSAEETEVTRGDGSHSPPPNCAICLGKCRNKCFTNSCMHRFCFKCLLEWSKVKPECPLCKQTFKAIIHNVKSKSEYEQYFVQQPVPVSPNPDPYRPFTIPAHLYPRLPLLYNRPMQIYMDELAMNTLDLTGTSSSTSNNAIPTAIRSATLDERMVPDPAQLLDLYRRESMQGETGSGSLSQLWRRYVYDRKLYAIQMPDITGRLRESSARFYRDNPSQIHRLISWINRDIVCLLRNTNHDVETVVDHIKNWLMVCNILSPEFRIRLQPFLGTKTAHFIHELNNFARSPYDMIGYDRVVQYSPNTAEEIVIEFSSTSSAGSDVESVYNIQSDPSTSRRNSQQPNSTTANSGGGFNLYTTTTAVSSQASAINLSTHNRGANGDISEGTTTTSTVEVISAPTSERPDNIVLSSTSSDECEFVLEQKPPHLRTPEMVSLNSNSDSDVVFVQETKTTPMPSGIAKWASTNSTRVRRAQRRRNNPPMNTNSFSTSNSDSDEINYSEMSAPKKIRLEERQGNAAVETSAVATTDCNTANESSPIVKEEFNQGASTSTGLQSRYRNTRSHNIRTRYYRTMNDTSDSDDMDDSRSSVSDSGLTTESSNSDSDSDTSWSKSRRKSNKQSLKRSRHRKINSTTGSSSRKSRRQLPVPTKSKRSKRTKSSKTVSNNKSTSASTSKKKKTIKRSRRKSSKSKSTRTKRNNAAQIESETSEEEGEPHRLNEDPEPWVCTLSYPTSPSTVNRQSENEPTQSPSAQLRFATSSPTSNSTASDANDATERPSSSATLAAPADSFTPSSPDLPLDADDNPNAKLPIYSDSD